MALEVYETRGRIDYRKGCFDTARNAVNGVFLIHPLEIGNAKFVFSDPKMDRIIDMFAKSFQEKGEVGDFVRAILRKNSLRIVGLIEARSGRSHCQIALILIPFLPHDYHDPTKKRLIRLYILAATKLAKFLGAGYVGLGAFNSVVTANGKWLDLQNVLATTSGAAGTAASLHGGTLRGARNIGIITKKSILVIVGATGGVGLPTTMMLAPKFKQVILVARKEGPLVNLGRALINEAGLREDQVIATLDIQAALKYADVSILATSVSHAKDLGLDAQSFKPGSLVVDAGRPKNLEKETVLKGEFLAIDGGVYQLKNGEIDASAQLILQMGGGNLVYGCLAETILCCLQGKTVSQSIGARTSTDLVKAVSNGFKNKKIKLAKLRMFDKPVTLAEINRIRLLRLTKAFEKFQRPAIKSIPLGLKPA